MASLATPFTTPLLPQIHPKECTACKTSAMHLLHSCCEHRAKTTVLDILCSAEQSESSLMHSRSSAHHVLQSITAIVFIWSIIGSFIAHMEILQRVFNGQHANCAPYHHLQQVRKLLQQLHPM